MTPVKIREQSPLRKPASSGSFYHFTSLQIPVIRKHVALNCCYYQLALLSCNYSRFA